MRQHRFCAIQTPLDPNIMVDPPAVIRVLEQGWHKHIPLHMLSHSRCRVSSHKSSTPLNALTVTEGGQIHIRETSLDASGESSITVPEFFEAWPGLCNLIESHLLSPDKRAIADAFRSHFTTITRCSDFSSRFPLYVQYDIRIRELYVQQSSHFSPALFHQEVWHQIVDSARSAEFQALRASLSNSFRTSPRPSMSASSPTTGIPSQSFLPKRPSGSSARSGAYKSGLCFICLDPSHRGLKCPRKENGYLAKSAEGQWKAPGDIRLCFKWNGPYGCSNPGCEYKHACTICGTSAHSAQSHPTL